MDEEIKELLKKNLEINKEILQKVDKVNRFVMWQRIFGFLKFFLIVVPLIWGFLYLPGILKNAFEPYKELLGEGQGAKANILQGLGVDENKIPASLRSLTK
jgi:hypothetical protein